MAQKRKDLEQQIERLGVLADPVRRRLYTQILSTDRQVSREEAAQALGISRSLAAHHLEKLVEAGLLEISFRRLSGKSGPGAGRPSKLYRRSTQEIELSVPPRRYELAARLLAEATQAGGEPQAAALDRAAEEWGRKLGAEARTSAGEAGTAAAILQALLTTGFEPRREGDQIVLENCPFTAIQRDVPTLTCGMNFALCRGILRGLQATEWTARLEPRPGRCCVVFEHEPAEGDRRTA